jgi:hypothetical protein
MEEDEQLELLMAYWYWIAKQEDPDFYPAIAAVITAREKFQKFLAERKAAAEGD